ncbi:uncharacterized protein FTOL_12969 [Fusarium torulosum]|uniref:LysM domain-containing protein n=1 Tax=Fusarium torulosum TaxID=33205 RepID=A0AAE8MNH7_9HYPO|nr:uncharacterized protein FTOL_12969 [Fusarium torulosum]
MHLTTLLAVSLLPQLPYARSIPARRAVNCVFDTSPDSRATCATFAEAWGVSEEDLKALNPGIKCPNLDTEGSYCVIGSVTDGDDEPSPTAVGPKSTVPASTKVTSVIKTTATPVKPTVTQQPSTTKQPSGNGIKTPDAIQEGMVTNCNKFHYVSPTTSCQGILNYNKISLADFFKWNPAVGKDCSGLWADTNACVGVIGSTPSLTTTTKPKPVTTTTKGNGIKTPEAIQEGMVPNCNKWHFVGDKTTCQGIIDYNKISLADFIKWNPAVGKDCSQLWKGTSACVGVIGSTPSPTTAVKPSPTVTTPANGIKTPLPIQDGMVSNCNKWHFVKDTTTCQGIVDYNNITLADFIKWNPAVGKDCSGLWKGTNACVGVVGSKPQPTATAPSNGVKTPLPIQEGMVKNCVKFHYISSSTTCQALLKYDKITMEQFFKWNPAVKKDCSGLWKDTNACVGVK